MKLLKYTNTTNPTALINGMCILTDEELTAFTSNIEVIKTRINSETKFIFHVGEGFIQHEFSAELDECHTCVPIDDADLPIFQKYGIDNMGFARHFVDGVIGYTEDSFVAIPIEIPIGG